MVKYLVIDWTKSDICDRKRVHPNHLTVCMCLCVSSTDGAQNISKVQTALEARCLTLRVIGLTVSHSTHCRRGRLAQ